MVTSKLDERVCLQPLTASINRKEWVTIIGRNGSGKSTLAAFISGYELDRYQKIGYEYRSYEKSLPIVTQTTSEYLIGSTPYEDLIIAMEQYGSVNSCNVDDIGKLAKALQIEHLLHRPLEQLSGGERQLIAVAGCLLMDTPLLILDEITSMLSPQAKETVISQIRAYCSENNIAVIWITQQLDELLHTDTVWVMDKLELIYQGTAERLFAEENGQSTASQLGLPIPWATQKAMELMASGKRITHLPFSIQQLVKEVQDHI